jgi:hypothetical protein
MAAKVEAGMGTDEYRTDEQGMMNEEVFYVHHSFLLLGRLLFDERMNRGCSFDIRYSLFVCSAVPIFLVRLFSIWFSSFPFNLPR